jgi:hypothetical protein
MGMRIRVLAGCFAMGVTALLLTGTAARAAPESGAHVSAIGSAVSLSDYAAGGAGDGTRTPTPTPTWTPTPTGKCHKPRPTPTRKCQKPRPTPTQTPAVAVVATPSPVPSVTSSAAPSGGANTGGGGSIGGGGGGPLVAGGTALALASAGLGLFAFRRWRKTAA